MKVSEIYGKPKSKPEPTKEDPTDWSHLTDGKLCRRGTNIWINHNYGPGWVCKRCGWKPDLKQLFK